MASQDEINSTLKNIVSNVGLLANSTAVVNSLAVIDTTLNGIATTLTAIATAIATIHSFGGSITFTLNSVSAIISNPQIATNGVLTFSPANPTARSMVATAGISVGSVVAGSTSLNVGGGGSAAGTELFMYVGYNP